MSSHISGKSISFDPSRETSIVHNPMFGGGFWSTPREDEWRRRRSKEHERECAIRDEEEQRLLSVRSAHAREMETQRQELVITKNLLRGTRRAKRERDDAGEGAGNEESSRPTAAQKTKQEQGSKEDMWETRESLLALSYAMFDTLYDKPTFDSAPFVKFLLKQGEVALAEQIALCGLEKSNADGKNVSFILEELLPISDEPDHLVEKIQEELSEKAAKKSGNDTLVNWLLSKEREEEAFSTILLHPNAKTSFLSAFSMATTPERRLQLAKKCPRILSDNTIGCFPDGQWLPFIRFLNKRQSLAERLEKYSDYRDWNVEPKEYLLYAVKTSNAALGQYAVDRMLESRIPSMLNPDGYCYLLRHKENTPSKTAIHVRDQVAQQMRKELGQLNEIVETKEMQNALRTLDINPRQGFADRMMRLFPIPTTTCCPTRHAEIRTAQNCATCRHAFNKFAAFVGAASVLRRDLALPLVQDYGLTRPLLREDGTWSLPVNKHTESGMATLFGTLEERQVVCVGQPTLPPPTKAVVIKKEK
jgi:hypothetical protein